MTSINPIANQSSQQAMAFKGQNVHLKKMLDKLGKSVIIPMETIDKFDTPLKRAINEGCPKEEIKEIMIRDYVLQAGRDFLDQQAKEALSKLSAKNAYKPL